MVYIIRRPPFRRFRKCLGDNKAKSTRQQGVFKVKKRVKAWQVRGILFQQLQHKQVPKKGMEPGVRKVGVPCWHTTLVARQNRSTKEGSKFEVPKHDKLRKNGLNGGTNASPKWDRTRCPKE